MDKRTFRGMVEAGEPLIQQAIDAMREYHQAQDGGAPAEEIERLCLLAESLFQVMSDYQLRVIAAMRVKDLPHLNRSADRQLPATGWRRSTACFTRSPGGAGQNDRGDTESLVR